MRGTVKFFASLREAAGLAEMAWELADGATVETLVMYLQKTLPDLDEWADRTWVAVNRRYASLEMALKDGDEVALFPPVSGG
jgi:molybdopterin converting factor subunit 1